MRPAFASVMSPCLGGYVKPSKLWARSSAASAHHAARQSVPNAHLECRKRLYRQRAERRLPSSQRPSFPSWAFSRINHDKPTFSALPKIPRIHEWLIDRFEVNAALAKAAPESIFRNAVAACLDALANARHRFFYRAKPQVDERNFVSKRAPLRHFARVGERCERRFDGEIGTVSASSSMRASISLAA